MNLLYYISKKKYLIFKFSFFFSKFLEGRGTPKKDLE